MESAELLVKHNINVMHVRFVVKNTIEMFLSPVYTNVFENNDIKLALIKLIAKFHRDYKEVYVGTATLLTEPQFDLSIYKVKRNEYILGFITKQKQEACDECEDPV